MCCTAECFHIQFPSLRMHFLPPSLFCRIRKARKLRRPSGDRGHNYASLESRPASENVAAIKGGDGDILCPGMDENGEYSSFSVTRANKGNNYDYFSEKKNDVRNRQIILALQASFCTLSLSLSLSFSLLLSTHIHVWCIRTAHICMYVCTVCSKPCVEILPTHHFLQKKNSKHVFFPS